MCIERSSPEYRPLPNAEFDDENEDERSSIVALFLRRSLDETHSPPQMRRGC